MCCDLSAASWSFEAELMDPRRRGEYQGAAEFSSTLGRVWAPALYTFSTFHCMSVSLADGVGLGALDQPSVDGINTYCISAAVRRAGKDVTIVSVDGGCPGVENVKKGVIGATSQQYPLKMAEMGVKAIVDFDKTGEKPQPESGKDFIDTGVTLITDEPQDGVESEDTAFGLDNCWG